MYVIKDQIITFIVGSVIYTVRCVYVQYFCDLQALENTHT